jgi:hypothetical protein
LRNKFPIKSVENCGAIKLILSNFNATIRKNEFVEDNVIIE